MEKVNLYHIFHDPFVKPVLPNTSAHFDTYTLVYTENIMADYQKAKEDPELLTLK